MADVAEDARHDPAEGFEVGALGRDGVDGNIQHSVGNAARQSTINGANHLVAALLPVAFDGVPGERGFRDFVLDCKVTVRNAPT